jgi:hypothetical protein
MVGGSSAGHDDNSELCIENAASVDNTQRDFRINIPDNTSNTNDDSGSGNLLSSGFRWLFGSGSSS